ncbi:type 2 lanthipeptide synthetase LanM family protein [Oscillatoria sp. HE19RPO]|uniref:type 2 lanthipeptide synthetase LanM family protein n=1 Tax=Oscillatoria sp. HE19RPO TaxID=2954806 RepID=UPI0020C1F772|nr:type 2 lanthipeptide synthetase LanM family protein [Oscillatoria sp. HE19RPO]
MKEENSQRVQWYRGIPLRERIASGDRPRVGSTPLGDRRLQRWRSQTPFNNDIYFAQRLASDGLTEPEFQQLLGESSETLASRFSDPPDWIKTLSDILSTYPFSALSETGNLSDTQSGVSGFLTLFSPLIAWGRSSLHQKLQTLLSIHSPDCINSQTIAAILYEPLPKELLWMSTRTLVLELNVARIQGKLSGNSSAERFSQFIQQLQQPEMALALWTEFPVLTRQILNSIQGWITVSYEFVERLCQDWPRIIQQFIPDSEPGGLVHLNSNAGDPHNGGRSVAIAEFSSGFKLVYKPRSLSLDIHFQNLLNWLNERGNHPPFQLLNVLNSGEYCWVEYVTAQPCSLAPQIERFYQRQGGYLALLYALQATDFYSNNIIALGEQPILVDLESLFHPRYSQLEGFNSDSLAERELDRSVLSVGILPMNLWGNQGYGGIDISGLGNSGNRMTPDAIPTWQGVGTDEMKISRQAVQLPPDLNRPTLNGASVNLEDYTAAIITGFTEIYRVLVKNRDKLVGKNGLLNEFAEDEIRVVLRATRTYGLLLQEGFHPDLLRDALDRDRLFDKLWVEVPNFPSLARAIPAEIQDLWQGDIPRFTTQPNSRHLKSEIGEIIADFLPESSLDSVRLHLQRLDETNLERQVGLIRAEIASN